MPVGGRTSRYHEKIYQQEQNYLMEKIRRTTAVFHKTY